MNILEAIAAAKEGKCIRRPEWPTKKLVFWEPDKGWLVYNPDKEDEERGMFAFLTESVEADDWVAI